MEADAGSADSKNAVAAEAPTVVMPTRSFLAVSLTWVLLGLVAASYHPLIFPERAGCDWSRLAEEWDDRSNFVENELVRTPFSADVLRRMFSSTRINVFEPVGWLAKALVQAAVATTNEADGKLSVEAHAHRLATLGLHSGCAVAVFAATASALRIADVGRSDAEVTFASAVGAAVWATHPLNAEVVAWASCQPYALATLFVVLMLLSHLQVLRHEKTADSSAFRRFRRRVIGPILYALATLSKSATIPAPASVFALNLALRPVRGTRSSLCAWAAATARDLAPYALVTALMTPITFQANQLGHDPEADLIRLETGAQRAAKAVSTVWFCLTKVLLPFELRPHYAIREIPLLEGADDTQVIVAFCATLGSLLVAIACERPLALAVWIHVAASFLPTCGLVQHGMVQRGGDRYCYLPMLAIAPIVACGLLSLVDPRRRRHTRPLLALSLAILLLVGGQVTLTSRQTRIWQNDHTLLSYSARLDPHDWRVLDIYAEYLMRVGDPNNEAPAMLRRSLTAVELMNIPPSAKSLVFRGKNLVILGQTDEGCSVFFQAKALFPDSPFVINNAAICELLVHENRASQGPNFRRAHELAKRDDHIAATRHNLQAYELWERNNFHGQYDGSLVY